MQNHVEPHRTMWNHNVFYGKKKENKVGFRFASND